MKTNEIEKRIEALEVAVAVLEGKGKKRQPTKDKPWYRQIPKFGGNAAYEEAMKLGREYRKSQVEAEDQK